MPRGQHPNSLANLKKGRATQFGAHGDSRAKEAQAKGAQVQVERRNLMEEMRSLLDEPNKDGSSKRKVLVAKLIMNMEKSPEWYKLGLRIMGELPPEQVEVSKPAMEMADEIKAALEARSHERQAD
jgi:hypothetical protein